MSNHASLLHLIHWNSSNFHFGDILFEQQQHHDSYDDPPHPRGEWGSESFPTVTMYAVLFQAFIAVYEGLLIPNSENSGAAGIHRRPDLHSVLCHVFILRHWRLLIPSIRGSSNWWGKIVELSLSVLLHISYALLVEISIEKNVNDNHKDEMVS